MVCEVAPPSWPMKLYQALEFLHVESLLCVVQALGCQACLWLHGLALWLKPVLAVGATLGGLSKSFPHPCPRSRISSQQLPLLPKGAHHHSTPAAQHMLFAQLQQAH